MQELPLVQHAVSDFWDCFDGNGLSRQWGTEREYVQDTDGNQLQELLYIYTVYKK